MSNANEFRITAKGVLTKYTGPGGDVVIPNSVTKIDKFAFKDCISLERITIPSSVTRIGHQAFSNCENLKSVVISGGVTYIGEQAFVDCINLETIVLPDSVTCIEKHFFWGSCNLKKITMPTSVATTLCKELVINPYLRIHISDIYALPLKFRLYAALCFVEDGALREDPRFESHMKYLKSNATKLGEAAAKNPSLLALLCREKYIKAKDIEAFCSTVQQFGNIETIAMILDYQSQKLTSDEKEEASKKKEEAENQVFDRAVARIDQQGIRGLNFAASGHLVSFKNRTELKAFIKEHGGTFLSSISPKVDYLIVNNPVAETENLRLATELGIEVISEAEFNAKADRL